MEMTGNKVTAGNMKHEGDTSKEKENVSVATAVKWL
jgi:hypothetical protein